MNLLTLWKGQVPNVLKLRAESLGNQSLTNSRASFVQVVSSRTSFHSEAILKNS